MVMMIMMVAMLVMLTRRKELWEEGGLPNVSWAQEKHLELFQRSLTTTSRLPAHKMYHCSCHHSGVLKQLEQGDHETWVPLSWTALSLLCWATWVALTFTSWFLQCWPGSKGSKVLTQWYPTMQNHLNRHFCKQTHSFETPFVSLAVTTTDV